jgi:hypothetical protein
MSKMKAEGMKNSRNFRCADFRLRLLSVLGISFASRAFAELISVDRTEVTNMRIGKDWQYSAIGRLRRAID